MFGDHSLRAGFVTQAAKNGATAFDIMRPNGAPLRSDRIPLCAGGADLREAPAGMLDCRFVLLRKLFPENHRMCRMV